MVIGNPTDDWNFQQELNRYMDWPTNHPGALADVGGIHDRYQVSMMTGADAHMEMVNVEDGSPLLGTRKRVILIQDAPILMACYQLPHGQNGLEMESCLSPDYYRLLRQGRQGLHSYNGGTWSGFDNNGVAAWVRLDPDENITWAEPGEMPAGHGFDVHIKAHASHFHVLIGCGQTDDQRCQQLIERGRNSFHQKMQRSNEKIREVRR